MPKRAQTPPKSFEDALTELDQILSDIEAGQVPLEETLVKYERGQFLIGYCRQVLGKAEKQIEMVGKGSAETKDVEGQSEIDAADD
jgi:exodeoxyribonuclease VII small subunit